MCVHWYWLALCATRETNYRRTSHYINKHTSFMTRLDSRLCYTSGSAHATPYAIHTIRRFRVPVCLSSCLRPSISMTTHSACVFDDNANSPPAFSSSHSYSPTPFHFHSRLLPSSAIISQFLTILSPVSHKSIFLLSPRSLSVRVSCS